MDEELDEEVARRAAFDRLRCAIEARMARTPVDIVRAEAAMAAHHAAQRRDILARRADAREVPRAGDVRQWIFPERVEGMAYERVGAALATRGEPRDGKWLVQVLLGGTGLYKTGALARAVARHDWHARYIAAPFAADALSGRPRCFSQERDLAVIAETLYTVDLVAIDELGTEPEGDAQALENLIALRVAEGRATILAGNMTAQAFVGRYRDPRLLSRLRASQGLVVLAGTDGRRAT